MAETWGCRQFQTTMAGSSRRSSSRELSTSTTASSALVILSTPFGQLLLQLVATTGASLTAVTLMVRVLRDQQAAELSRTEKVNRA